MTGRGGAAAARGLRSRLRSLAGAALLVTLAGPAPGEAQRSSLGPSGIKAFEAARAALDAATTAAQEGERSASQIRSFLGPGPQAGERREVEEQAAAAERALAGYREQAQASAAEAIRILSEMTRAAGADPARRLGSEQRALLAAREAEVMAARARSEAERLRALLAETRLLAAGDLPGARKPGPAAGPRPAAAGLTPSGGDAGLAGAAAASTAPAVVVPNLVGARLPAAVRDLEEAGLRLGATTGPREGFVVKQAPEAGQPAARGSSVGLTLSATAATVSEGSP